MTFDDPASVNGHRLSAAKKVKRVALDNLGKGSSPVPDQSHTFLEYVGIAGATKECVQAVERLLLTKADVRSALILTFRKGRNADHALLLTVGQGDEIIVKSGFASGYGGTGPSGLSHLLHLLDWHKVELDEVYVDEGLLERADASALTLDDLESIRAAKRIRPMRFWEYILDPSDGTPENPWARTDAHIPMSIVDARLAEMARDFWNDPDGMLLKGHRQLEETIRKKAGISIEEATGGPASVYKTAFNGDTPRLAWPEISRSEHVGRSNLFIGTLSAYRHVRAHRSVGGTVKEQLREFLLLNHLFSLEADAERAAEPGGG